MKRIIILLSLLVGSLSHMAFAQSAQQLVQAHLLKQHKELGLTAADVSDWIITDQYQSQHNGLTHLYFQQQQEGIAVHTATGSAHIGAQGKVWQVQQQFIPRLTEKITSLSPTLSPNQAIEAAALALHVNDGHQITQLEAPKGVQQQALFQAELLSLDPIPVKLMFHPTPDGQVRLSWNLVIRSTDGQHWSDIWIDAEDGSLLAQEEWLLHCEFEQPTHGESHTSSLPQGLPLQVSTTGEQYRAYPLFVESPNHGANELLFEPSDSLASPFGWHDTDGAIGPEFTITRGNNVLSQEDENGNNGSGYSPDGGASLNFDFPLDPTQPLSTYRDGAITNLFVWNNFMHDLWYQYGFDEASGNFQDNTYNRGGQGSDYVLADARDGSGTDNANFGTPPDGSNPRMQMFLWDPEFNNFTVNSPAPIAGTYNTGLPAFGPGLPTNPLTEDLVLVEDGSGANGGCNALTNGSAIAGKIALLDRGGCPFVQKVQNAQDAGAIAVIVINDVGGGVAPMGGNSTTITIPSVMVSLNTGNLIKAQIASPVNVSLQAGAAVGGIDGDLDNGIIAHEYGHGISNRLTGGPAASGCLTNDEQAGEGWSDWFGLAMTTRATAVGTTPRGIGTFAQQQPTTGGGIRNFPYTTNMNINPQTYDDIKTRIFGGNVSPHGVGEVMCTMLWDLYWALVDEYGFDENLYTGTGGNNVAMQLVVDGLKLQPCGPGFVDVRDAILLADEINYGGANTCLIWETFARRGLGFSADQGSSASITDGTEAFDLPPTCQPILYIEKVADRSSVPVGDTITYTLTVVNQTGGPVTNVTIRDTLPLNTSFVAGSADCGGTDAAGTILFSLGTMADGQIQSCSFQVTVNDSADFSSFVFQDNLDSTQNVYVFTAQTGTDKWDFNTQNPRSGTHSLFVPNAGALNDQIALIPFLIPDSNSVFSFWHWYNTEAGWDGGFLEILPTVSGGGWQDMAPYFVANGYNQVVGFNNPAGEREVFGGNSGGYIQTKADLSIFSGEQVFIRFRFVSDDNTFEEGWFVDDLALGDEFVVLNQACVFSDEGDQYCATQTTPTIITEGVVDTTTTAIGDLNALRLQIFPNPSSSTLTVAWESDQPGELRLRLYSPTGQLVREQRKTQVSAQGRTELSVQELPVGTYFLEVQHGQGVSRHKVVKQ